MSGGGYVADCAWAGGGLFIIDNRDSEWDVLRHLAGWCRVSGGLDVASAYFEIGALLALDGRWQKVDAIRILMGDEVGRRTRAALTQALAGRLDASIENEKVRDDFLDGVPAIGVNGKYLTAPSLAGSNEAALRVVDELIARERKGA